MTEPIPSPAGLPFVGNILDLQDEVPFFAIGRLIDVYGPIVKFNIMGAEKVVVGNFELFDELCDETRFYKLVSGPLVEGPFSPEARGAEGLFAAIDERREDWAQAHRILLPAFGPLAIENMFPEMHDIASQMVLKWARQGPNHHILAPEDFSRLTLDTIALCAMDYRFNSFYQEDMHPFVKSMNNLLTERSNSAQLGGMLRSLMPSYREQLKQDSDLQFRICQEVVDHRRQNPTEKKDLMNAMLYGKDPKTGETMRDRLIAVNMQTFLIAGHETTSGLLSFAFLLMLKNPKTFFAAQQEVDRVIGKDKIEAKHLRELKYINAVLRETLRLNPTAPAFQRAVRPENTEDFVLIGGGKYEIPRGQSIICNLMKIHTDPKVWGDDANEFVPERMMDGKFEKLPKNAWKPFGTGVRSCIGRAFAWQEALLATAMILQNFNVELADPDYEMKIVQSLTIKPKDFNIKVSLRSGITATGLQHRLQTVDVPDDIRQDSDAKALDSDEPIGMTILYGSNTGTCQALAQKLASQASQHGIKASVNDLDSSIDKLPTDSPVVVISASYEGLPPDNAARFVAWLEHLGTGALAGVKYAVFGCGNSDWTATYQRIPTLIDDLLAKAGAERLTQKGATDAKMGDIFADWDAWTANELWTHVSSDAKKDNAPVRPTIEMDVSKADRAAHLQQNVQWATVTSTKKLTNEEVSEKRQIEFELPEGVTYSSGDYLAVLPLNPEDTVRRVVKRFGLPWDGIITINKSGSTTLPTGKGVSIFDLLRGYVEIGQPVTRKDLELIATTIQDEADKADLLSLAANEEAFKEKIAATRMTILDLLEQHPASTMPFPEYLALLPPLRPRYYSISSSPLASPTTCALTYSVIDEPSWSSTTSRFVGVAGTYLRSLSTGDKALVAVRSTNHYFRLPADPEATPIVMICAGSGIAPFRAFVQERAVLIRERGGKERAKLAPALLFVGCRSAGADRLYGDELDEWQKMGAVDVRYAFSRDDSDANETKDCRYVQDRLLRDRADVLEMWDQGARIYVCGSGNMAKGVGQAASQIVMERRRARGEEVTERDVEDFKVRMRNERFIADIFD
ncbi:cytochrome P450 oxidoreductase OrdA-like [Apiospora rasikravindrae]|uniref:Bifunctional cytochrome P450/NADPH--P450 reductase n=1 Tax=Apiospora rasikravindrae TaxID=990691 RepID=A0ABR1SDZ2_9PEZI